MRAEKLAQELGAQLLRQNLRAVTVESCTGGGVARMLTEIPGSSQWFERGFVTYCNHAKVEMVGVARDLLDAHGAVSVETAAAMAEGGLQNSRADCSVSVTGIAGPGGGSAEKPAGTVCFAYAARARETYAERMHFHGDRKQVRARSVEHALAGLLKFLAAPARE